MTRVSLEKSENNPSEYYIYNITIETLVQFLVGIITAALRIIYIYVYINKHDKIMEFGATHRFKSILLTGPPGIGKTTVCKKIIQLIVNCNYTHDGFYTEEVRSADRKRIGFDVIRVNNIACRGVLARIESALEGKTPSKFHVGNYQVFIDEFERIAVPCLESQTDILMIDEMGKMELLSKRFHDCIEKLFCNRVEEKPLCIVATIPEKNRIPQRYSKFFEKFYNNRNCKIVDVNIENRDKLPEMLFNIIANIVKND